jgi:hypothetical protein
LVEIIAKNPDKDMKPPQKSINFDLFTIDDMEDLRKIKLFSDPELYDKLAEKCQKVL